MLDFTTPPFAIAGLLAAAGPVIVHLLNRRRHRVVAWGPMDFLREAMQRQKKVLELRDLILLALRMLAMLALGLGLSRPFWRGASAAGPAITGLLLALVVGTVIGVATAVIRRRLSVAIWCGVLGAIAAQAIPYQGGWSSSSMISSASVNPTANGAVHAILLLDNSRSLGVATAAGTALDRAKAQARRFIDQLPPDSRVSLIPLAGTIELFPQTPFSSRDARRALDQILLVDATADMAAGLEQAEHASRQASELPAKRVVVWSDLQRDGWGDIDWPAWSQRLPDVQIAPLVDQPSRNLAVTAVALEDGFAGTESPGRFLVRVAASASLAAPVPVEVLLSLDDVSVGSQLLELSPGQTREVEFQHQFDVAGEPGRPNWVTATAELKPADPESDQLSADNRLSMTVPVVDTVPVVFIDQYGDSEDVTRNRIGETHALRHLLAPKASSTDLARRTVQIQHVAPDQVTQQLLETARLVVIGGIESPDELVPLLREYVTQGGPLVLLAGGEFDPARWQAEAWRTGRGLLPAPLRSEPLGSLPESTPELHPFFADFRTMQNELFLVEGEDPETLRSLFETLPFFQAVQFDMTNDFETLATDTTNGTEPKWWLWGTTARSTESSQPHARRVLAMFTDGRTPWVIEHPVGRGRVVWFASGVSSDWNLLRTSGAMYVFHRLMSRLMSDTLPARNFTTGDRIAFALPPGEARRYQLTRPAGVTETLPTEAIDADLTGVWVRRPVTAGAYRIATGAVSNGPTESAADVRFCVQAPASESDLTMLSPNELRTQLANGTARVLEFDELPRVTGGALRGQSLWRWLLGAMLAALFLEMAILAAPAWRRGAA